MKIEANLNVCIPAQRQSFSVNRDLADRSSDLLPLLDFAGLLLTGYCSLLIRTDASSMGISKISLSNDLSRLILIAAAIAPFILYDRCFSITAYSGNTTALARTFLWRFILFSGVTFTIAFAGRWLDHSSPLQIFSWLFSTIILLILNRLVLAHYLHRLSSRTKSTEMIAVIGEGRLADDLALLLRDNAQLFGLFSNRKRQKQATPLKNDQSVGDLIKQSDTSRPDRIVVALPELPEEKLLSLVERLRPIGIPVDICSQHAGFASETLCVGHIGGKVPVTLLIDRPIKHWSAVLKSAEDLILSLAIIIILAPILAAVALAITLDSPGPIIFSQRRHGYKSREFDIYKFRTMYFNPNSDKSELKQTLRGDNRVTRVGRFLRKSSLDELPQILNVLKGNMSLVGPRPHAVDMRTEGQLGHEVIDIYMHRHRVKPGITGWSQANGCRGATDTADQLRRRIELDLYYVENWSLLFDLKIILMTFREVLRTTNAY